MISYLSQVLLSPFSYPLLRPSEAKQLLWYLIVITSITVWGKIRPCGYVSMCLFVETMIALLNMQHHCHEPQWEREQKGTSKRFTIEMQKRITATTGRLRKICMRVRITYADSEMLNLRAYSKFCLSVCREFISTAWRVGAFAFSAGGHSVRHHGLDWERNWWFQIDRFVAWGSYPIAEISPKSRVKSQVITLHLYWTCSLSQCWKKEWDGSWQITLLYSC